MSLTRNINNRNHVMWNRWQMYSQIQSSASSVRYDCIYNLNHNMRFTNSHTAIATFVDAVVVTFMTV
jgi:hypothetical protein